MKKILALLMALTMVLAFAGCNNNNNANQSTNNPNSNNNAETKSEGVMTHAEYMEAELVSEVVIEAYVQGKMSWYQDQVTIYAQDRDGAYFLYNMACSKEDYEKLEIGTKIKVTGSKVEWSGEIEIADATFEILDGSYIAPARDVTALLGTDDLEKHMNEFVSFKGLTVEASKDGNGEEAAFLYKWNGSGQEGDDLYFDVSLDGETYTFLVRAYLCDKDTEVYAAVKALNIGDTIDMEGFLYWYNGVNPHVTSLKVVN